MKFFKSLLCLSFVLAAGATQAKTEVPVRIKPLIEKTVVLVHGAFADGSSFNKIVPTLQAAGLKVVSVQHPLTSLADDAAAVHRAIENAPGPVILVGHSYGGQIITEAGDHPKVESLVYVAAFAPSEGQSPSDLAKDYPVSPGFQNLIVDSFGFVTLSWDGVKNDFAQDLSDEEKNLIWVTQGPTAANCFTDKATKAAWKTKPSWYIVAQDDRMIQPDLQRALATQIKATTVSLSASHVPMLSKPSEVAATIIAAAALP